MRRKIKLFSLILLSLLLAPTRSHALQYDVDTGFRPGSDGFSFENYGGQVCSNFWSCNTVQNLTSVEMRRMFGDQVCKTIQSDGSCTLLKVAESWMKEVNRTMSGGHCEGMAVLSSLFFDGTQNPSQFGSRSVPSLQLENNPSLQRELAYWFATQWFMDGHLIENDPTTQLKTIIRWFQSNPQRVLPLGIYKRNLTGGHAITAYAVKEQGNGIYRIMVYDNNYPNEERYITVDTNSNSWTYSGAPMANIQPDIYDGKGKTNPFQISPVDSRLGKFECDFCPASASSPSYEPSQPETPWTPVQPDDTDISIPDTLLPWLFPDSQEPGDDSGSSSSIEDLLLPWLFPDSGSPTQPASPDSSGSDSIYDLLMPWLFPDGIPTEEPGAEEIFPVQLPTITPQPLIPTAVPDSAQGEKEFNKIYVDKDINIYIETDANQKAGYDWEAEEVYDTIPNVSVNRSVFRSSARMPTDLKYYLWINSPETTDQEAVFDVEITSPGTVLQLRNVLESYREPNFVYNPPVYRSGSDVQYEAFEIMADPNNLPEIEFTISDENGEYSLKFTTAFSGALPSEEPLDFVIYHDYDYSQVGIWITTAYEENSAAFQSTEFQVSGEFYLWDDVNERYFTTKKEPIRMDINGMFFFNYKNWLDGSGYYYSGDLDGNGDFETWAEIGKKL